MTPPEPRGGEGLLPCVWCGGKAKCNELRRGNYKREGDNYQVVCNKCRARGPLIQNSQRDAIEAWNRRPSSPPSGGGGPLLVPVDFDVEYRIFQGDDFQAGSTDLKDAEHYAVVYGQDGPVACGTSLTFSFDGFLSDEEIESVRAMLSALPAAPLTTDGVG